MDEELHERIRDTIRSIPSGKVATYGDIAEMTRSPSPRLIGRILSEDGHDLPWHRVLRANGTPAPHLAQEQLARLRTEGVLATGEKVDLAVYRWSAEPNLFG
ncbi:MAG: MGMT family protein [Actinomycetota bacterium]|nr:MGMT family protein [Actinomycetota bacterium]